MLPFDPTPPTPNRRTATAFEPRIGGAVRSLEEEEELQLALTILRIHQRLADAPSPTRRR